MNINLDLLNADLKQDEGVRFFVYDDATGKPIVPGYTVIGHPTIGVGRTLDIDGISPIESDFLLSNNATNVINDVEKNLPWASSLTEPRQRVLVEMAFNMGIRNLLDFSDTLRYIQEGQYHLASLAMLTSLWAKQVGARAERLADMMDKG